MSTNAAFCRENGWSVGELLCCTDEIPDSLPKFVRITAIGETEVLARRMSTDSTVGPEQPFALLPYHWRCLTGLEWQGLVDTHTR
ncbi:MAG: hypothetical protein EXS05_07920 [Planctomycetaceae bacterium]|nr:hypothetical protein [Planctomycetaceae bacterium]